MVASHTRGPGFESSHRQLLLNIYLLLTVCRKDENKEKEAGTGPIFLQMAIAQLIRLRLLFCGPGFESQTKDQRKRGRDSPGLALI